MTGLKGMATEKQRDLLNKLNVHYHPAITKQQAYDLISKSLGKQNLKPRSKQGPSPWAEEYMAEYDDHDYDSGNDCEGIPNQ
jgi:hypothetical protein